MRTLAKEWAHSFRIACALFIASVLSVAAGPSGAADGEETQAGPDGPAQIAFAPERGPGPVVIVISGQSGPGSYRDYAGELAKLGYYAILLTGKDILNPELTGEANLKKAIDRAQRSPHAKLGKVAVIGFSLGGGGALRNAAPLADLVSVVVAYYPYTKAYASKMEWFTRQFQVPVLVMAAQLDRYMECCVVESMRAMEAAARKNGKRFELVVYPEANHGFNLKTGARGEPANSYRGDEDRDAWRRTLEMLKVHHPLG